MLLSLNFLEPSSATATGKAKGEREGKGEREKGLRADMKKMQTS